MAPVEFVARAMIDDLEVEFCLGYGFQLFLF